MSRRHGLKIGGVLIAALLTLYCSTVNYLSVGEVGLAWNPFVGEPTLQSRPGWQVSSPFTLVSTIETRPQRVCLTSGAHAAVNCRLVQFDPAYYRDFVAMEGWHWYWWYNRLSFNMGHQETYRGFRDVLRGYAYSSKQYPFVKTLQQE